MSKETVSKLIEANRIDSVKLYNEYIMHLKKSKEEKNLLQLAADDCIRNIKECLDKYENQNCNKKKKTTPAKTAKLQKLQNQKLQQKKENHPVKTAKTTTATIEKNELKNQKLVKNKIIKIYDSIALGVIT